VGTHPKTSHFQQHVKLVFKSVFNEVHTINEFLLCLSYFHYTTKTTIKVWERRSDAFPPHYTLADSSNLYSSLR